ncbi:MAG TPA: acyltransferase [Marmoricola sp.]|nr:acyltransferase [Marmoricola sp.]
MNRLRSLDGLRGVAATVVVCHHVLLVVPAVAATVIASPGDIGTVVWWLDRTPLRILWAGQEAVLLFFVLSGYVLTHLISRRQAIPRGIRSYYGQRLVRLYVPVWGATALAVALALLVPRATTGLDSWIAGHESVSPGAVLMDLTLVVNTSSLNTPLWSLQWEVLFSLALPVAWWVVRGLPIRRHWMLWSAFLVACSAAGRIGVAGGLTGGLVVDMALTYVPVFGVGMVLAHAQAEVTRTARRLDREGRRRWAWPVVVVLSLLGLVSTSYAPMGASWVVHAVTAGAALAAAAALLVAVLQWPRLSAALETPTAQWLGTRSFSIYLVHEPIVVAAAIAVRADSWGWLALAPAVVVLAGGVAAIFYRLVERPAIQLSHRVGHRLEAGGPRVRARTAEQETAVG